MSWTLRLIDIDEWFAAHKGTGEPIPIGSCWYLPNWGPEGPLDAHMRAYYLDRMLSCQYLDQHLGRRPPMLVQLPPGFGFCPDEAYTRPDNVGRNGWTVAGALPRITVTPSINCVGVYHGFITDGVLTDDVEGRTYK